RKLQALALIVAAASRTIKLFGQFGQALVNEPPNLLPVLEHEGDFMAPDLEHGPGACTACSRMTEAGIEKAGVMHAEFADQRIVRHHLRRVSWRHMHRLLGSQDVKLVGIQDDLLGGARINRIPIIEGIVRADAVDIDKPRMTLGSVADEAGYIALQID